MRANRKKPFKSSHCVQEAQVTDFHLVLEGWIEDYPQLWRESQANPATAPKNLGSMGYQGRTSVPWMPDAVVLHTRDASYASQWAFRC